MGSKVDRDWNGGCVGCDRGEEGLIVKGNRSGRQGDRSGRQGDSSGRQGDMLWSSRGYVVVVKGICPGCQGDVSWLSRGYVLGRQGDSSGR